ncbi:MAG: glycine cleavage system protein GcvH [Acidobacteriota bacterium]|nr:glycine cleavage system protein GcvH [Acidobacteriota bacterium]
METKYTPDEEWLTVDGEIATVGITNQAQKELGDLVFVELPKVGQQVTKGQAAAAVESVKAAFDVYSPLTGEVIEVNPLVVANPGLVNTDPMNAGWFFRVRIHDMTELSGLMSKAEYEERLN